MTQNKSCELKQPYSPSPYLRLAIVFSSVLVFALFIWIAEVFDPNRPKITIVSMNFSITENPTSAKWDLLIRTTRSLPGDYICLEGDFQAFIIYKNVIVATSPPQRYQDLKPHWPHLLRVSAVASEEDINNITGKNIFDDFVLKERGEVRFGLRLVFPDCSDQTTGTLSFACDEAVLRFDSSSRTMTMASKNPTCLFSLKSMATGRSSFY